MTTTEAPVATFSRWTTDIVATLPKFEGGRYEIIDGELYVTHQPHARHQALCDNLIIELGIWGRATGLGRTFQAPGVIFAADQAVAPDLVWVSHARLASILGPDGKFHDAPDLMIEIVSPGKANAERDREKKHDLYGRYGVAEYWIADWQAQTIDIYERDDAALQLARTLGTGDTLTSALLAGFTCPVARLFEL
jgi:Uma2 family endonuclease